MQLSPRRRQILRAFMEAMRPKDLPMDQGIRTDTLLASFEDYFRFAAPQAQAGLPFMLDAIEYGTIPFMGTLRPFSKLSRREQDAYLQGWVESSSQLRRDLFRAVRAFFCIVYYAQKSVLEAIQYDHQSFAEEARRMRYERHGDEIHAHEMWLHEGAPEPLPTTQPKTFEA